MLIQPPHILHARTEMSIPNIAEFPCLVQSLSTLSDSSYGYFGLRMYLAFKF